MKNVTIAIDDYTHKQARIHAARHGTSLSALVKNYLQQLADEPQEPGVREMPMTFRNTSPAAPVEKVPAAWDGPPWYVNGKWSYTRDGKPRQPGGLRGKIGMADDFDEWPADILESFDAWSYNGPGHDPMPFDEKQLQPK